MDVQTGRRTLRTVEDRCSVTIECY